MHCIQQSGFIVGHHFKTKAVFIVYRFALRSAIHANNLVFVGEKSNVVAKTFHAAAIAMDEQQRLTAAIYFGVNVDAADVVIFGCGGIAAVSDLGGLSKK